jgi:hypothetical protein
MAMLTMRKQQRGMRRNLKSWILATALLIALVTTTAVALADIPLSQDGAPGTRDEALVGGTSDRGVSGSSFDSVVPKWLA